jgi:heme/copper-type cytochrome/quinol oxidase subunit 2
MTRLKNKVSLLLFALLLPALVSAQEGLVTPTKPTGLFGSSGDTASDLLVYIINLVLAIVGLIAVAFLVYGGFRYITSAGNDETAESAKKTIQNAIIGLIVVILSYVIVVVIINALRPGGQV